MLIIGAGGLAKELVLCLEENEISVVAFFDDISLPQKDLMFDSFPVLHTNEDVLSYWRKNGDTKFHIGIGNPELRNKMTMRFENLGGELVSLISKRAIVGSYDVVNEKGVTIMQQAVISNSVKVGKGTLVYYNSIVTHDVEIGEFCEISPGATLLGGCKVGAFTQVGTGAIILPRVSLGKHVVVAAGSVVRKNVPDYCLVAGVPANIKRRLTS